MAERKSKSLANSDINGTSKNVPDVVVFGDGDLWRLLCKASSAAEGWMKSSKAMAVPGGCLVQVTTQQQNPDGSYAVAEAVTFVPGVEIIEECSTVDGEWKVTGRKLGVVVTEEMAAEDEGDTPLDFAHIKGGTKEEFCRILMNYIEGNPARIGVIATDEKGFIGADVQLLFDEVQQ